MSNERQFVFWVCMAIVSASMAFAGIVNIQIAVPLPVIDLGPSDVNPDPTDPTRL